MSLLFVRAALAGSLLAVPLQASSVEPGKQFFFKDWAAACDNTLSCEALSIVPEGVTDGKIPTIFVSRDGAEDSAVAVKISLNEPKGETYRILIDGRQALAGKLVTGEWPIRVESGDALKLARAIGRGRKLVAQGADGSVLGETLLSGSAAALRHIDATQRRAGTRTALAAIGRKAARPNPVPLPVIVAKRIGKQEILPGAGAIVSVVENSQCTEARTTVTQDTAYSLGKQDGIYRALTIVDCGSGAYNMSAAVYIGASTDGKKWSFEPARFDYAEKSDAGPGAAKLLMNASWDQEKQQISSYYKGRGLGDCGRAETYVWDGSMFRLVEAFAMDECRGATEWMRVWRAKVEFSG